ncbi:NTP transferase domain-containing protein [Candidatus Woesearchaeota archaeon]|nr:NTP transferase domain-containing protein [Candidatus Woesearchaeota archaeon]
MKERVTLTLDSDLLKDVDRRVDGYKIKNRSHAVELFLMQALGNSVPKTAVILAGGRGVRLAPITHELPKPLIPLHDKPLIQHLLELLKKYNVRNVIISVGYKADKIKEALGNGRRFGLNITYVEEQAPLGTAGPLKLARQFLTETFICCNADELKDIDLMEMYMLHKENRAAVTIALTTVDDPSAYGVARLQGSRILEFVEKPKKDKAPSNLINAGLYIMEPEILDFIPDGFAMVEKDLFPRLASEGRLFGYPFSGQWFDTGTLERYERAIKEWKDLA